MEVFKKIKCDKFYTTGGIIGSFSHTQTKKGCQNAFQCSGHSESFKTIFFSIFGQNFMNFEDFLKYFTILVWKRKKKNFARSAEVLFKVFSNFQCFLKIYHFNSECIDKECVNKFACKALCYGKLAQIFRDKSYLQG